MVELVALVVVVVVFASLVDALDDVVVVVAADVAVVDAWVVGVVLPDTELAFVVVAFDDGVSLRGGFSSPKRKKNE